MRLLRSCALLAAFAATTTAGLSQSVTSPEKFFGFQLGADRKMARWDKIVDYYAVLEKESGGKMKVINMGPTENGNPFLMVIITSAKNLADIKTIQKNNLTLVHPQNTPEAEIKKIIATGKVVIVQSMSMHATEIGGTQMAPELAYDMISRTDEDTKRILDNVVLIEVPCFNPDGELMVTDWYNKTLGTPYEGSNYPSLYAKYIGHDDNRDALLTSMRESQYMASLLFTDWRPEVYVDHHHMGSYGPRISLPPYAEPSRPYGDPLMWREIAWYGAQMAYKETENGYTGAINNAIYSGWGHFGFHWITPFHNIDGMLTESASAKLATPLYVLPEQLQGNTRGLPKYEEETIFPDPWPGGWWHLRDIVNMQKTAAWAAMDIAARNRETVLYNAYQKAINQTKRGAANPLNEYVIPANQFDPITVNFMIQKLLVQGIDIQKTEKPFTTPDGHYYEAGTFIIPLAQPKMGLIRNLLDKNFFPDNDWTRDKNGDPIRPYDLSTDALNEFMGVRVDHISGPLKVDAKFITEAPTPAGKLEPGKAGYVLSAKLDATFLAVNQLQQKGIKVSRIDADTTGLTKGDFLVTGGAEADLKSIAKETGVDFNPVTAVPSVGTHALKRLHLGLYQRYYGGNVDEGWTRWLLEHFDYDYNNIFDPELKKGDLNAKYDVIILPDDATSTLTGEAAAGGGGRGGGGGYGPNPSEFPAEYRSGFGEEGVKALKDFVQKGGTVITLGQASNFAIDKLGVRARNAIASLPTKQFWCPGSTLKVTVDNSNPLAYGMPSDALALYLQGDPVFDIPSNNSSEKYSVIVSYGKRDILQSGWLVGEGNITGKAAMLSAEMGKGKVVLVGFRTQHRAQTYGTFKLLFNSLVN
ncbi:Zinc carboxypeptidase [Bryocella elongata]|uniref:Zinc carboxypeptidase n=1 Tax=Bryocella elongata TaxID=863522 RepID=A0A1H5ZJ71_9BACT|nr:M14 metallopeptidase family protein [Bryocella elongata]SEG36583.1 Zinc carboxypeptidase [Bryocella elongata]